MATGTKRPATMPRGEGAASNGAAASGAHEHLASAPAHTSSHLGAHAHHVGCGCGVSGDDVDGRKAVAVDGDVKERNLKRLRRIEGQVRGLQKMVDEDRYCADILTQISSVHEALRAVGRELMRNHLKHCASSALRGTPEEAESMYDELVERG